MPGHQQPLDHLPFENMTFHEFRDIGFGSDPIPGALGINDDTGAVFAVIQTPGLVGANGSFYAKTLDFFFEEGMQTFRSEIGTTAARIALRALIDTDKNMMGKSRHRT